MKKRVAIIGVAFRFPSTDVSRYWDDLLRGKDLVTTVESRRWEKKPFLHPNKSHPGTAYSFAAGSIGDVSGFDAGFFGISPREAAQIDPQQRLLLDLSWETFENAGVKPSSLRGSSCGVFVGIASADYAYRLADDLAAVDSSIATGNTPSIAANRLSYFYDLHGPSMAIDTACSSSLVAFHQACRSILAEESSHALAGGVSLHLHPYGFITFSKASMLSKRGRCSVFDASGDGYVRSEGGGLFLLKDYDQAISDGDRILAVVANSALNTDGRKSGLTVPKACAQAALLEAAYTQAGISPTEIDYIEAHGTGTAVGDPIETRALGDALGKKRPSGNPLPIGSVKSNLGHLEAASGVAGLVKALYCIRHRIVPATIGLETPNPHIPFEDWNIEVVTENKPLRPSGRVVVGVNSFGFGGSNAHVILESHDAPRKDRPHVTRRTLPVVLSAASEAGLKSSAANLAKYLWEPSSPALYDIAYHAALKRDWLGYRAITFGSTHKEIASALSEFANGESSMPVVESGKALDHPTGPAFVYSGNGSQWAGMGRGLLKESGFRKAIQDVDAVFRKYADYSLMDVLAGKGGEGNYEFTEIAQPALFAVQVGITELLHERGIRPLAVVGHSVGEVAAAWASGALTLDTAVKVIYHRSRLQGTTKGRGQMSAVALPAASVQDLLETCGLADSLCIAGINSHKGVTIAGNPDALTRFEEHLDGYSVFYKRLELDYAFHSPAMDSTETGIRESLANIRPGSCAVPFFSTVSGSLQEGRDLGADYWWRNIRQPVLFEQAIRSIQQTGINVFVEIGPHPVLRSYINDCLKNAEIGGQVIPTVKRDNDDPQTVWSAAGQAVIAGASVQWEEIFPVQGRFVELPSYPWQKETHWHSVTSESLGLLYRKEVHPLLGYRVSQQDLTWENQLDTQTQHALAGHIVGDATVFPGTGYIELALAAARSLHHGDHVELEELEILAPLLLSAEDSKVIRLSIQSADGSFNIRAREHASTEPWTLHAVGRILHEAGDALLKQSLPSLPPRHPDFNYSSHQAMTEAVGLSYGSAFRAIDYGWVEGDTALALFRIPEPIEHELGNYLLHPALLDCAFQLIIQLLKDDIAVNRGIVYVPTKAGRISLRTGMTKPRYARATLLRRSPHSLLADFAIFDEEGSPIAFIKEARFRSIRLHKRARENIRHIGYHCIPKPLFTPPEAPAALPFEHILHSMKEAVRRCILNGVHRRYAEEIDPLLDELCSRFTLEALDKLAGGRREGILEKIHEIHAANPQITPFLDHLLRLASADGLIGTEQSSVPAAIADQATSPQDIWNSLIGDYPDYFQIIHAVGRIGMHLPALLEGVSEFRQICPVEASLTTLGQQVLGTKGRYQIGQALSDALAGALDALPEGRRLSVIEISEGQPSFVQDICSAIDFDRGDFCFASPSFESSDEARHLQERLPAIQVRHISPDQANGTGEQDRHQKFDLAIVSMDFLRTDDAITALGHVKRQLNPNGSLIVLGQHPTRWMDFIFGSNPVWWSASPDGNLIPGQQSLQFWRHQVEHLGYSGTEVLELVPDADSGPYILVAKNPAEHGSFSKAPRELPRSWLVFADSDGLSAAIAASLCTRLQELGDLAITSLPGDQTHVESILRDMQSNYGQLDGIAYLAGLNKDSGQSSSLIEGQIERCVHVSAISKACESTRTSATCWLVTGNVMTGMLPRSRGLDQKNASSRGLADAALWGFGRTLINEATNNAVRLIDLQDCSSAGAAANAIARELDWQDREDEVVISANGERFVPRMRLLQQCDRFMKRTSQDRLAVYRLGFEMPGQLRNLRWEKHPYIAPAEDELEVEIRATGLNFRDIMYALGLLSDEAIENGFAGATLGLEFTGTVVRAGAKTSGFDPGDKVVGFGSASFSNRILTKQDAVSHIPPDISFEAAATIPSTFFTAYYALCHLGRLREGEKVLIHGAAGGVGIAAIQIAKWCGAEIFASAGSDEKRDFLRLLGVEHILDSRSLSYADEIMALTEGQGIDVVLNSLAGEAINRNFRVLKPFGRFLELGKRDFYENTKIGLRPFRNNITYFGIDADQLMWERPELTRQLFAEVMALFHDGVLHPLPYRAFEAENVVDAFRYMQQSRQIGKIVVTYRNGIPVTSEPRKEKPRTLVLPEAATYLVTGGLSGFGLKTAQWLVAKGARHLILISRSGPESAEAKNALSRLEQEGIRILAAACDVTEKGQLAGLLQEAGHRFPPLKGIVHAAAVIDDGLIRNLDAMQIRRVFEPKILGAMNLHELTIEEKLDFFILFSSATTLFGNPGQGNYVAANTWLEALARHRRSLGLPATCVLWGAIEDAGFLARNEKIREALQKRMGGSAISSATALEELERILVEDVSEEGVLELDWKALLRFLPSAAAPKFSEFSQQPGTSDAGEDHDADIQGLLASLSDSELIVAFSEMLKQELGEILRVSPDKIDPTKSVYDMGLDSLMGVELVIALESRFGIRLPVMALSESPTISKLADRIIAQLRGNVSPDEPAQQTDMAAQIKFVATQHAHEASADEIANFAEEIQQQKAPPPKKVTRP